jgi:pimeloyl-ACP methyl ester carboxylesterase
VATYVVIHGAGSDSWYWHRVMPLLRHRGHDVVAPDLPVDDPGAGLQRYADAVLSAIARRGDLVVVAQSLGGFVAPLVCERRQVDLLVLVNAMVPKAGESDWWTATRCPADVGPDFDPVETFLHDVPASIRAEAGAHVKDQAPTPMAEPHPLERWPDVPTAVLISADDRFFPAEWQRRQVRDRLGIDPIEIPGGHCPALARPHELVEVLERLRVDAADGFARLGRLMGR